MAWLVPAALFFAASPAHAEDQTFPNPAVKGYRLDYCKHWGSECGKPAADLFCHEQGFEEATKWTIDPDIGAKTPTLVFGDGRLCAENICDGFRVVQCTRRGFAPKPALTLKPGVIQQITPKPAEPAGPAHAPVTLTPHPEQAKPPAKSGPALATDGAVSSDAQIFLPAEMVGGAARITHCLRSDCEFQVNNDFEVDPAAKFQAAGFKGYVKDVKGAGAARYELSTYPIGGALNFKLKDTVASGEIKDGGYFSFDFKAIVAALGRTPGSFYVRVVALDKPGGSQVGAPSNVIRIFYTETPEPAPQIKLPSDVLLSVVPGPNLQLVSFEYQGYKYVNRWPPGCQDVPRDTGTGGLSAVGGALEKAFGAASELYDSLKSTVIDIADTLTLGAIPRSVWSVALNTALIAAGIPPDIPNLNNLMSQGAGYFASEMAQQAVAQIPAANLAVESSSMTAGLRAAAAASLTEQELRDRLQDEIARRSRDALVEGAKKAEQAMLDNADNVYCRGKSYYPTYLVSVRNLGSATARAVDLKVGDGETVYYDMQVTLDIGAGETVTVPMMPSPKIRATHHSQLPSYDATADDEDWWDTYYFKMPTEVSLYQTGDTTCVDPIGPETYKCYTAGKLLYKTPGKVVLDRDQKFK
jgi:hypothetical protein